MDDFTHVETRIPTFVLSDSKQFGEIDGSSTSGTASAGGGTASYSLFPKQAIGTISGQSAKISFSDRSRFEHESQADAFVRISNRFRVNWPIEEEMFGNLRVRWAETLSPNDAFEQEYFARFGGFEAITVNHNERQMTAPERA